MIRLETVLDSLKIEVPADTLAPHWEDSLARFVPGQWAGLEPASISASRAFAGLPAELDEALHHVARRVSAAPELSRLAWHQACLVYDHPDYTGGQISSWPALDAIFGDLAGVFYLLIGLDAVPRTRQVHARSGIPEAISRACFSHYGEAMWAYAEKHDGRIGMSPGNLDWLRHHVKGEIYRLGRHEYMVKPFGGDLIACRHRHTREVVALAAHGTRFAEDGFMVGNEASSGWTATLEMGASAVVGTPISPAGYALRQRRSLPFREWEIALSQGDLILEVHIPPGGNMTLEACRDSMARALVFFAEYFPEQPCVGFACHSWILNPELARIYRPDSNMVRWQQELYLFPTPSGERAGVYFVFGTDEVDPATARRDTSLRRSLLDHMATGGRLISGGMFMLTEDFAHFGKQVYRSHEQAGRTRGTPD